MAEATNNPKGKKGSTLLIVLLIVLLVGLGFGAWSLLKPKSSDGGGDDEEGGSGAKGRSNKSNSSLFTGMTEDEIRELLNLNTQYQTPDDDKGTITNPWFINDPKFQEEIDKMYLLLQQSTERMDWIRAKYDIGKIMIGNNSDQNQAIKELFGKLQNMDLSGPKYYLSFPVYGTSEPNGKVYRQDLQDLLNAGWQGLNLTDLRNSNEPWWLDHIGLNLLVGTTVSNTPSTHNVWMSWAPRTELDFFKRFNGHWVSDQQLADSFVNKNNNQQAVSKTHPDARAAYCAGHMYTFAGNWVKEIDRLDKVTRWEALRKLMAPKDKNGSGMYVTFIDPNDATKNYAPDYNVDTDKEDTDPVAP